MSHIGTAHSGHRGCFGSAGIILPSGSFKEKASPGDYSGGHGCACPAEPSVRHPDTNGSSRWPQTSNGAANARQEPALVGSRSPEAQGVSRIRFVLQHSYRWISCAPRSRRRPAGARLRLMPDGTDSRSAGLLISASSHRTDTFRHRNWPVGAEKCSERKHTLQS